MNSVIRVNDDLTCRGRILRREWKLNKPVSPLCIIIPPRSMLISCCVIQHLPRSTSLPELELVPAYRPLFTCQQCGFSNLYIPLCLWCKWSSLEAADAFKSATSRRGRRLSGPGRVTWKPDLPDLRGGGQRPTTLPGLESSCGSEPAVATNLPLLGAVLAAQPHHHPDRDSIVKATEGATSNLITELPQKTCALRIRRGLPATSVVVPSRYPTTTIPTIPPPSSNTASMPEQVRHTNNHTLSLPPIVSSSRTLRRKHHMTFPRQKSTRSLRSWTPAISPPQAVPVTSVARLGHPSRPYYTAIRPHLNNGGISPRPNTPTTPVSAPPTLADKGQSPPSPPPGRPSFEFARPRSSTVSGWSLSGEIELQIELSQRREKDGVANASGKRGSIVRGVRKLGTGLRDLVLWRG